MTVLGACGTIESIYVAGGKTGTGSSADDDLLMTSGTNSPVAITTNPYDKGGWSFVTLDGGGMSTNPWTAFTAGQTLWHYGSFKVTDFAATVNDPFAFIYPSSSPTNATGRMRMSFVYSTAGTPDKFMVRVEIYTAGAWSIVGTSTEEFDEDVLYTYRWAIKDSVPRTTTVIISTSTFGSALTNLNGASLGTAPLLTAEPCFVNSSTSKNVAASIDLYEYWSQDSSGSDTAIEYTTATTSYHVVHHMPVRDLRGQGRWGGKYTLGATLRDEVRAGECWRHIDDGYDNDTKTKEYLYSTDVASAVDDALFALAQQTGTADSIKGVYIAANSGYDTTAGTLVDKLIYRVPSESATLTVVAPSQAGSWSYKWLPLTPGSAAWTKALFNEFQAGVRRDRVGAVTEYCSGLIVGVLGTNLVIPSNAKKPMPRGRVVGG